MKLGKFSCHFLLPGGSIDPGYVFQLVFGKKTQLLFFKQPLKPKKK
jgi:hypothetical protein